MNTEDNNIFANMDTKAVNMILYFATFFEKVESNTKRISGLEDDNTELREKISELEDDNTELEDDNSELKESEEELDSIDNSNNSNNSKPTYFKINNNQYSVESSIHLMIRFIQELYHLKNSQNRLPLRRFQHNIRKITRSNKANTKGYFHKFDKDTKRFRGELEKKIFDNPPFFVESNMGKKQIIKICKKIASIYNCEFECGTNNHIFDD